MNYRWESLDPANYREDTGRFISEYAAFPAIPEPASLDRFLSTAAQHTTSAAWRFHIPNILAFPAHFQDMLDFYTTSMFGVMRDNAIGIDAWLPYGRLVQGEALSCGIEHFRRGKWNCSGTLFWQYNSIWPSADWGVVDYFSTPKAGYFYTKRAYAPVLVTLHPVGDGYEVWLVNDRRAPVTAQLQLHHATFHGASRWSTSLTVVVAANSAGCVYTIQRRDLDITEPRSEYLAAVVSDAACVLSRAYQFLVDMRALRVPAARLQVTIGAYDPQSAQIIVSTDLFARTVRLELPDARFDDNYFHLQPGEQRSITVRHADLTSCIVRASALNAPATAPIALTDARHTTAM